ncbi:hypothetical protein BH11MYX4_BH11MYX4_39100 [soil metagenome]
MAVEYGVELGDIRRFPADLLVLKYAQKLYGADEVVAHLLESRGVCTIDRLKPAPGRVVCVETAGALAAKRVMFVGVPPLREFRYAQMRAFARHTMEEAAKLTPPVASIISTVHGPGYGLDVEESLQAMVFGFQLGLAASGPLGLSKITFVEQQPRRADLLRTALRELGPLMGSARPATLASGGVVAAPLTEKKTVFVAMPFTEEFEDVWEFGIYAPIRRCGYACEKVDVSAFHGDIVQRIQEGIREARFVVADLTQEKPNVYLEVGYAWGLNKPVILLAREGQKLHFDLSHHRCIFYKTIGKLAVDLERVARELYGPEASLST